MAVRTYRIEVIGRFDRPVGEVRARLTAEQPAHDVFGSAFTPEGTLTYGPALTRFSFRYLLTVDEPTAVEADELAALEALTRAEDWFASRAIPVTALTTSVTCLEDLKPRRRR